MKGNKKVYIFTIASIIILILLSILKVYKCPFKYLFGIPCPSCGLTRAFISLFKLNIKKSFYYHALWPVVAITLIFFCLYQLKIINISKKRANIIIIILIILFAGYYIIRHAIGSPIVKINFNKSLIFKLYNIIKK